jgi:hypothetical protein
MDDFRGLVPGSYGLMDAQDGFNFWFSVGAYHLFNNLIPGPIPTVCQLLHLTYPNISCLFRLSPGSPSRHWYNSR